MRVGFIGGGTVAEWHAERVLDLEHDVVAIADIDHDARQNFVEEYGASEAFEDYHAMVEEADLDVVAVTVPNGLHADCTVAALEEDLHVFVEKPLAHTLDAAERIETAAAESDGEVMVGFMKAFEPGVEALASPIEAGEFGDVYEVSVEYVRRRGIPQIGSWFTSEELAGGGAVVDIGPHMLHLALHVLDFPEVESVSASMGSHFGTKEDYTYLDMWGGDPVEGGTFDVEDHARALVQTEDANIHLNVAWASNREPTQQVQILGSDAGATLDPHEEGPTIFGTHDDRLVDEELQLPTGDAYAREWEYFFEVLAGERTHNRNTLTEGIAVQRVIDAIYRSGESGETVEV